MRESSPLALINIPLFLLFSRPLNPLAQFPRPCVSLSALTSRVCCPHWPGDGSPCGERSGRGSCMPFRPAPPATPPSALPSPWDFRLAWPSAFFAYACACHPRFSGFDCGKCAGGWRGPFCERWAVRVRKGVHQLSRQQWRVLLRTLKKAKGTISHRYVILATLAPDRSSFSSPSSPYASSSRFSFTLFPFSSPFPSAPPLPGYLAFLNATVYDLTTWMHYLATKPLGGKAGGGLREGAISSANFAHGGPAFAPWHRRYLAFLEEELRILSGDEDFSLPYWNWTRTPGCDVCRVSQMGRSDNRGKIRAPAFLTGWKTVCTYDGDTEASMDTICLQPTRQTHLLWRRPGGDPGAPRLPTTRDVSDALQLQNYDSHPFNQFAISSFRNVLEGYQKPNRPGSWGRALHNLVHTYLNGTISKVAVASNDPIFLLHHAFIDKIWEDWLRAHPDRFHMYPLHGLVPEGHRWDSYMVPYLPPVRIIDYYKASVHLGYTYSNSAYEEWDMAAKPPFL
ncbi:tyrosinase-like [Hemitrygon akajei]|uniref:tyrosinase-like n=1 Tax=Hemitrygon akajei TaxID=2704970 RepID=UPI003BF9B880